VSKEHEQIRDDQETEEDLERAQRTLPDHTEPAPDTGKMPKRH
jgi:hypothetical protein